MAGMERLFVGLLVLILGLSSSTAEAEQWLFDVYLDDQRIGEHTFTAKRLDRGRLVIDSVARFDIKVLMVPVFRYRHSATETWDGSCLAAIDSATKVNGQRYRLEGRRAADRFLLDVRQGDSSEQVQLPACVATYAYWSPAILATHNHLLNSQTGAYDPVAMSTDGPWTTLNGPSFAITLRYLGDSWAGLQTLRDGRQLDYRLRSPESINLAVR
jgi:hypothetical protein